MIKYGHRLITLPYITSFELFTRRIGHHKEEKTQTKYTYRENRVRVVPGKDG